MKPPTPSIVIIEGHDEVKRETLIFPDSLLFIVCIYTSIRYKYSP